MRRQARLLVGFFDQILRPRSLSVKPHHRIDRRLEVGHEYPIAVLRRVEQLILLRFAQLLWLRLLLVPQSNEPVRFPPSFRLVAKLALAVGIRARRSGPARRPQRLHSREVFCADSTNQHPCFSYASTASRHYNPEAPLSSTR